MKTFADTKGVDLTKAQRAAIETIARHAAVVAGAGSGKTTVLIERLRKIIGEDWSGLDRVLAITFTEKAAAELKNRLRHSIPPRFRFRLENAWIGTFHATSARMVRQNAPLLGLDPSFKIMDENAAALSARQSVGSLLLGLLSANDPNACLLIDAIGFKTSYAALEELMQFRWHAERVLSSPKSTDENEAKILNSMAAVFAEVRRHLDLKLSRMCALDFQELEIQALKLITEHPGVLDGYRTRFQHILVDEFQDTSDAQTEFVLRLFDPGKNRLCIVGDPRQSIYRFRGANVDCFAKALGEIKKNSGEVIHLLHNFRSTGPVVEFINRCQEELSDGLFGHLAEKGVGAGTEGMICARRDKCKDPGILAIDIEADAKASVLERRKKEAAAISSFILSITQNNETKFNDIVCLFQALTGTRVYETAFRKAGIPFRIFGGRGLLARQEIIDLFGTLKFASDPMDEVAMLGLLRSPLIGLSDDELVSLAGPDGDSLISSVMNDKRCILLEKLKSWAKLLRPSEVLREVLDFTGYELVCDSLDPSGGMTANIERFISLAQSIERQEPASLADFTSFIGELKEKSARLSDPPSAGSLDKAIRCMTVHAAKGLEFPVVILPDLIRGRHSPGQAFQFLRLKGIAFKLKDPKKPFGPRIETELYTKLKQMEENETEAESKRLLYVAMTRARDRLVLPIHRGMKKDGPWHQWLLPIADKCAVHISAKDSDQGSPPDMARGRRVKEIAKSSHENLIVNRAPGGAHHALSTFTVSQLESYDRCPQEYYLKYIQGVPASVILKDAEQANRLPANVMGSIVHGVLKWHKPQATGQFDDIIRKECLANAVFPDTKVIRAVMNAVNSAISIPGIGAPAHGEREKRFDWNFGGCVITGFIDWLKDLDDGMFEIVDFKTDSIEKGEVEGRAKEYDLQLVSYALAFEAAQQKKVSSTTLIFLHPKIVHTIPFDEGRRENGRKRIAQIIKIIKMEEFGTDNINTPCFKCPYHHNQLCWKDRLT